MELKKQAKILDRIRIELNPCRKNSKQESMFVICSFDDVTGRCLEVTVRRVLQVEYLVQHVNQKHGGHIIPVLQLYNFFTTERQSQQQMYIKIKQYLNDLIRNPHCKTDPKLYEFIFQQEVHFPHLERYDKVLEDAAVMSRRYLNTIFTRKQYGEVQLEDKDMLAIYGEFKLFSISFRAAREIILVSNKQHTLLEDIFSGFREIRGGLGKGIPPVEFLTPRMNTKMIKMEKLVLQGEEAYARWDVLREKVRQLHCNINKGLHEEHAYYRQKMEQLKKWTKLLMGDLKVLVQKGNAILQEYSKYLYGCKKQQAEWFCPRDKSSSNNTSKSISDSQEGGKEATKEELAKKEWNPLDQFKYTKAEWKPSRRMSG